MNDALFWLGLYLFAGIVLLGLFELVTHRISRKLNAAADETQKRMAGAGNYMSHRSATILFLCLMVVTWPFVFIGALTDKKDKEKTHGEKE